MKNSHIERMNFRSKSLCKTTQKSHANAVKLLNPIVLKKHFFSLTMRYKVFCCERLLALPFSITFPSSRDAHLPYSGRHEIISKKNNGSQSVAPRTAASASNGNLLEMKILGLHLTSTESEHLGSVSHKSVV